MNVGNCFFVFLWTYSHNKNSLTLLVINTWRLKLRFLSVILQNSKTYMAGQQSRLQSEMFISKVPAVLCVMTTVSWFPWLIHPSKTHFVSTHWGSTQPIRWLLSPERLYHPNNVCTIQIAICLSHSRSLSLLFFFWILSMCVSWGGQQLPWWSFTPLIATSSPSPSPALSAAPFLPSSVDLQPNHCCYGIQHLVQQ